MLELSPITGTYDIYDRYLQDYDQEIFESWLLACWWEIYPRSRFSWGLAWELYHGD